MSRADIEFLIVVFFKSQYTSQEGSYPKFVAVAYALLM